MVSELCLTGGNGLGPPFSNLCIYSQFYIDALVCLSLHDTRIFELSGLLFNKDNKESKSIIIALVKD